MSNELVMIKDNKAITTSLKIAEIFNKNHKDILRVIQNLECSKEFNERNFTPVKYIDQKGEKRPMFEITKDGFTMLAMGFTGKKAMEFKELYIDAFNKMAQMLTHNNYENVKTTFQDVSKQLKSIQLELFPRPENEINAFRSSKSTIAIRLSTEEKNIFKAECSLRNWSMRGFIRQCINNFLGQRKEIGA